MTSFKAGTEHGPKVHVATKEPTCPLTAADPPKSGHFRHMYPSLHTLSLVLVARDRGLWGWCGLRRLSQVSPGSCFPPGEEAVPAATPLLAEGPRKGPTRTRQAEPGVERTRTVGKESDLFYQNTLKELKIHTHVLVRTVCPIWWLTTKYCRWG